MKEGKGGNEVLSPLVKILRNQEYCEMVMKKDVKDAYLVLRKHDGLCWYEGLVEKFYSTVMELRLNRVIEVDSASHELLKVNGEEVNGIEHAQVLDLSDDGERWEGDVLNNKPFGWGVLYDSENRMVYEGFRIGEVNVCYGRSYYPDAGVIEYEGGWCEGKRWGKGTHFDQKSHAMFDGEWLNDSFGIEKNAVVTRQNEVKLLLHNRMETLHVGDHACNREVMKNLDLTVLSCLRELRVGNECFKHVEVVKLIGLKKLETVVIGEKCFTKSAWQSNPKSRFLLKNCDRLKELKIGVGSFHDCVLCVIEHLDSMEAMELGKLERDNKMFVYCSLKVKSILADCP